MFVTNNTESNLKYKRLYIASLEFQERNQYSLEKTKLSEKYEKFGSKINIIIFWIHNRKVDVHMYITCTCTHVHVHMYMYTCTCTH